MRWPDGFIAVDWGTTNRRAWKVGHDGRCEAELEDSCGVLPVKNRDFAGPVAELREKLGDLPLLMAGMIGSNRGLVEVPYVPCPAGLGDLARHLAWAEAGRCAIVPGLSYCEGERADVMRGEEVQILGSVEAGEIPADGLVCHPGTHNKWVTLDKGRIMTFRTVMTGELFGLLKGGSILAQMIEGPVEDGEAFRSGVRRGLAGMPLTAELFAVRARVLLGEMPEPDAAPFTSGILIGADVRAGLGSAPAREVVVMGRPDLTCLYSAALAVAGYRSREIDGERAFLAGIRAIAERIA